MANFAFDTDQCNESKYVCMLLTIAKGAMHIQVKWHDTLKYNYLPLDMNDRYVPCLKHSESLMNVYYCIDSCIWRYHLW